MPDTEHLEAIQKSGAKAALGIDEPNPRATRANAIFSREHPTRDDTRRCRN